jgi:tetratricopeptide (TPR) repeat protein
LALKAYSSAQDCFADAASIFHEFGDRPSEVRARCNLGVSHLALTDTKIAKQELRKSLAMSRDLHDRVVEVQSLHHLTILCEAQGQTTEALKYAREAHTILASQEDAPALRQITAKINRLAAQT